MKRNQLVILTGMVAVIGIAVWLIPLLFSMNPPKSDFVAEYEGKLLDPLPQTEADWRAILTNQEFHVLREKGTERAFSGKYHDTKIEGIYRCAGCGQPLFSSEHKYDSGTGWPSFWQPIQEEVIRTQPDPGLFGTATEVLCGRCNGHLGHVFEDGPQPTGLRYCMNSVALQLEPSSSD